MMDHIFKNCNSKTSFFKFQHKFQKFHLLLFLWINSLLRDRLSAMSATVVSNKYKRRRVKGAIERLSTGYLVRGPEFYCLASWVCDTIATMTGCWPGVAWCWADSGPPSSSIFGRLAWGSPGCPAKVSALGCLLTNTGGELEAWAAKICRGLLRPEQDKTRNKKMSKESFCPFVKW